MANPKKFILRHGGILPEGITEDELSRRWYPQEAHALAYMKSELSKELDERKNSTVDSDSRMMRFIRKHACDAKGATQNYREHLLWRKKENADYKHDLMIKNNLDPSTVPNGERVTTLMPQIPCSFELCDKMGNPLSIEYYGFNPENVLHFTPQQYFDWFMYCYEYKMLILEHFSLLAEEKALAEARRNNQPLEEGWGSRAMRRLCVIRDLKGFQLSTSLTPRIPFVKELLKVSQSNYPYMADHSFFTNTPWMFSVVWTVLKTAISSHTKTKIHMLGSDFHEHIEEFIDNEMLPLPLQRPDTHQVTVPKSIDPVPPIPPPVTVKDNSNLVGEIPTPPQSTVTSTSATSSRRSPPSSPFSSKGHFVPPDTRRKSETPSRSKSPAAKKPVGVGFLSSQLARIKSKKCSSVILSISEVEYPAEPPPCTKLSVRAKDNTGSTAVARRKTSAISGANTSAKIISEDSQEFQLPLTSKRFFVLSLDNKSIVDNMLTLDFELGLVNQAGRDQSVHSKLQVFIHPTIAIESLLCWVNFYNEQNQSMCLLKVVLSYQPQPTKSSKFNFFSSSSSIKKKKKDIVLASVQAEESSLFQAQQVPSPPPLASLSSSLSSSSNQDRSEKEEFEEEDSDEDEEGVENGEEGGEGDYTNVLTEEALHNMERAEAPIDMEEDNLTDMFNSFFQFEFESSETDGADDDTSSWYSFDSNWTPDSGKLVALDDKSTEWAIFTCSAIEVRKFAFESESEAREALEDWSFANILTRNDEEVDVSGIILAPNIGRIREAIDLVRPSPAALKAASAAMSLKNNEDDVKSQFTIDLMPMDPEAGRIEKVNSDWAVWTSEFFTVKRYGFDREIDAKGAMEEWMSVRILTYQDEEVLARCRWHTEAILAIRNAIKEKRRERET